MTTVYLVTKLVLLLRLLAVFGAFYTAVASIPVLDRALTAPDESEEKRAAMRAWRRRCFVFFGCITVFVLLPSTDELLRLLSSAVGAP